MDDLMKQAQAIQAQAMGLAAMRGHYALTILCTLLPMSGYDLGAPDGLGLKTPDDCIRDAVTMTDDLLVALGLCRRQ